MNESQASSLWNELTACGSVSMGRRFDWPRPYILQTDDELSAASEQLAVGYVGDPGDGPVRLTHPVNWSMNPYKSRPWRIRFMCLQPMDAFLYAYQKCGDAVWIEYAVDLLCDWIEFAIVNGKRGYEDWADMPVGYRAIKIGYLIDLAIRGIWHPNTHQKWLLMRAADAHLAELTKIENISMGNHGVFQMHGLAILSEVFWNSDRYNESRGFLNSTVGKIVSKQFNHEGMHLEHSPNYHWWMSGELRKFISSGWHNDIDIIDNLNRAEEVKNWLLSPSGKMFQFGDTAKSEAPPNPSVARKPDFDTKLYATRVFPDGGYAFVVTPELSFVQTAAYHSKAHKHSDDLHIELHAFGQPVLSDAGSVGYKLDDRRRYILSTRAHNTVQVDALNYPRGGVDRYGSALEFVECYKDRVIINSSVNHHSIGSVHERLISIHMENRLVVHDFLKSTRKREYIQWFHFAPGWKLERIAERSYMAGNGEVSVLIGCRTVDDVRCHYAETKPELNGWRAIGRELVPAYSLGFCRRGRDLEFLTEIEIFNGGQSSKRSSMCGAESGSLLWSWRRSSGM